MKCNRCNVNEAMHTMWVNEHKTVSCYLMPMFFKALNGRDFKELRGMTGKEVMSILEGATRSMTNFPDEYKKLNPANGWGHYEGAFEKEATQK